MNTFFLNIENTSHDILNGVFLLVKKAGCFMLEWFLDWYNSCSKEVSPERECWIINEKLTMRKF